MQPNETAAVATPGAADVSLVAAGAAAREAAREAAPTASPRDAGRALGARPPPNAGHPSDAARPVLQGDASCVSGVAGRHFVADDRGRHCPRLARVPGTDCCDTAAPETRRYLCGGCDPSQRCCSEYEACVSCCQLVRPARPPPSPGVPLPPGYAFPPAPPCRSPRLVLPRCCAAGARGQGGRGRQPRARGRPRDHGRRRPIAVRRLPSPLPFPRGRAPPRGERGPAARVWAYRLSPSHPAESIPLATAPLFRGAAPLLRAHPRARRTRPVLRRRLWRPPRQRVLSLWARVAYQRQGRPAIRGAASAGGARGPSAAGDHPHGRCGDAETARPAAAAVGATSPLCASHHASQPGQATVAPARGPGC